MVKQDDTDGYRLAAYVAVGLLVQISDLQKGHLSLTDAMVKENERIINQLKRGYPNLPANMILSLERHVAQQKETLREQRRSRR